MAKKIFKFQGKTVEELQQLSISELTPLFDAAARRKIKRGFTAEEKKFLHNIETGNKVKTHCRDMLVLPQMINKTVAIHNGKTFEEVLIQPAMVGHRLGEYAMSRKRVKHGSAGVGASRSTANQSKK